MRLERRSPVGSAMEPVKRDIRTGRIAGEVLVATLIAFSAGCTPACQGRRVGDDGGPITRTTYTETESGQMPGQEPIPLLSTDGMRFYSRPGNEAFGAFVEGITRAMLDDAGADGRDMRAVFSTRFGNDWTRMESAIKANVYDSLVNTRTADASSRAEYGIEISGQGDTLTVTIVDLHRARSSLRNKVRQFVVSLQDK